MGEILAAAPSDLMWRIVSNIAKPAVTEPPGELMYMEICLLLSSESRYSMIPIIWFAIWSSTCFPRKRMRSRYMRLYRSIQSAPYAPGARYATLGTPMGIMVGVEARGLATRPAPPTRRPGMQARRAAGIAIALFAIPSRQQLRMDAQILP